MAIAFKMTERVEQQICMQLCVELEHSSVETIRMIQKAAAVGTGDWQLHHDNVPADASRLMQFFGERSYHPGDSVPLQPRFDTL